MAARLKAALAEGRVTRVFGLGQLCHPKFIEIVGLEGGFDAVWLDQEHAGLTTAQIEEAARAARGCRGVNGTGADGRYGAMPGPEYFRRANAETVVAVQIEHADAVEDVERIAAVPDLDFLFIGPADLSQSMGIPGEWEHPRMWAAVERTARAAAANGVAWAILPRDAAHARRCVGLGCRMLSIGMDAWAFQKGLAAIQGDFAEFFGERPA